MNNVVAVDYSNLERLLPLMDAARHKMYDAIVALNDERKRLADGDVWEGDGANAMLPVFQDILSGMLVEEKRLNSLAWEIKQYVEKLRANESEVVRSAGQVAA